MSFSESLSHEIEPVNQSSQLQSLYHSDPQNHNDSHHLYEDDPLDRELNQVRNRISTIQQQRQSSTFPAAQNTSNWSDSFRGSGCQQANGCQQCLDQIFFIYMIYLYYTGGIGNSSFAWFWLLNLALSCFGCRCLKISTSIMLQIWAAFTLFKGTNTSEITLYFYLHLTDICFFGCICCCLNAGIAALVGLIIYSFFLGIKVRLQKYLRYRQNLSTINKICQTFQEQTQPNKDEDKCSICFESRGKFCKTECNHKFHSQCLKKWLKQHINCPLCRRTLY